MAVLGGGSWGTAVASIVADSAPTTLWARSAKVAEDIDTKHRNARYLGDIELTKSLRATHDMERAVADADVLVMGVPSHGFREALEHAAPYLRPWIPVVSLVKGLEQSTDHRMTEIVAEVLSGHPAGVLAGPNIASEVVVGYAAAATIAMPDQNSAHKLAELFVTCTSPASRNRQVGEELGKGKTIEEVLAGMNQVAEGVKAVSVVMEMATRPRDPRGGLVSTHALTDRGEVGT